MPRTNLSILSVGLELIDSAEEAELPLPFQAELLLCAIFGFRGFEI